MFGEYRYVKPQHCLSNLFDVHGVMNIVTKPTCFKNFTNLSLMDLVLSNVPKRLKNVTCIENSVSNCHSMICFATKNANRKTKKEIN